MKRKFLIASHGNLAKGFQSSLDILADKGKGLAVINAYVTPRTTRQLFKRFFSPLAQKNKLLF